MKGEFLRLNMQWNDAQRRIAVELAPGSCMLLPGKIHMEIHLAEVRATKSILFKAKPQTVTLR